MSLTAAQVAEVEQRIVNALELQTNAIQGQMRAELVGEIEKQRAMVEELHAKVTVMANATEGIRDELRGKIDEITSHLDNATIARREATAKADGLTAYVEKQQISFNEFQDDREVDFLP